MRCFSEEEIYDYCLDLEESVANPEVGRHISGCKQCSQLLERTQQLHFSLRSTSDKGDVNSGEDDPEKPDEIGGHTVLRLIGFGGMGEVWQAEDTVLDRLVAIKVIRQHHRNNPKFAEFFLSEAKNVARLDHPNIVRVYSAGRHEDDLYLAMEYVEGETLRQVELPDRTALCRVFRQLLVAIRYAHRQGIIHRDIKSSNVMVTPDGKAKILDFGLSRNENSDLKHTATGAVIGTIPYLSPELASGSSRSSVQSDIYALGVVLYELATGHNPYEGESPLQMLEKVKSEPIQTDGKEFAGYSAQFRAFLEKMVAHDLSERYASLDDALHDFDLLPETESGGAKMEETQPWTGPLPSAGKRQSRPPVPRKTILSRRWFLAIASLMIVSALLYLVIRPGTISGDDTLFYTWLEIPAGEIPDSGTLRLALIPTRNETGQSEFDAWAEKSTDRLLASIVQRITPSRVEIDRTGRFIAGRDMTLSSGLDPYLATVLGKEGMDAMLAVAILQTGDDTHLIQVRLLSTRSGKILVDENRPIGRVENLGETLDAVAQAIVETL
jgi:serine/threonine protein kinase